ncbi:MAG: hypothetical protein Q4Q03_05515 [Bowdeniella nasicola]|nr:hypothetical protein [Bowdeniella nasicola]
MKVIAGGEHALCHGGSATRVWQIPRAFDFTMQIYPFDTDTWVLTSGDNVWIFAG